MTEYNPYALANMTKESAKRLVIGQARRDGLDEKTVEIMSIAIDNAYAIKHSKRVKPTDDPTLEDVEL